MCLLAVKNVYIYQKGSSNLQVCEWVDPCTCLTDSWPGRSTEFKLKKTSAVSCSLQVNQKTANILEAAVMTNKQHKK